MYDYCFIVISIDQLDKADAPAIPDTYIYLLAVQCIVSLCEGFVTFSSPIYSSLITQLPRAPGDPANRLPPALNLGILAQDDPQIHHLRIVQSIISQSWPALLAALSFIIATNLSDQLFVEVLASYQAMTNVSGMLGLNTPRDAFFNSLSKFAVPTRVMSSLEVWVENPPAPTPRSATAALTEGLGLSGPTQPPSLSERNMACLKVFVGCALFLAGTLGESWYAILEVLQNADGVLGLMIKAGSKKGAFGGSTPGSAIGAPGSRTSSLSVSQSQSSVGAGSGTGAASYKHPLLSDLDLDTMQMAIQRLFDSSKNLEDNAFKDFVDALCKLSAEMVGTQTSDAMTVLMDPSDGGVEGEDGFLTAALNASQENVIQRRRVSGIYIPKTSVCKIFLSVIQSSLRIAAFIAEIWRFWYCKVRRCCNAQCASPYLSISRHCVEHDHRSSACGHSANVCPPNHSYPGCSGARRDSPPYSSSSS